MNHLDLFSGIGGFALAAKRVWGSSHNIVSFCEIDKYCQKVLRKHWSNIPICKDIKELKIETINSHTDEKSKSNGTINAKDERRLDESGNRLEKKDDSIDLITGGFPCQPFSVAGKQRGAKDDRYLWPEMVRVIKEFKPRWIVGENVTGIVKMELDNCISDLESEGYISQAIIIPACAVDARHRRDRVWIIAHFDGLRSQRSIEKDDSKMWKKSNKRPIGLCSGKWTWSPEPEVGRVANGIPNRVDRLKGLGNAIVPQVAEVIFHYIKLVDRYDSKVNI